MNGGEEIMSNIQIPLKQHVGTPCKSIVKVGENVKRGQLIAVPDGLGAKIHASVTGEIISVDEQNIIINMDDEQDLDQFTPINDTDTMLEAIAEAGVVGAGGAGFPTAVKLDCDISDGVFIVNAAECEALLNHNVKRVNENIDQLIRGTKYCMEITNAPKAVIAVKKKHRELFAKLIKIMKKEDNIEVYGLPDMYPAGDERVVVREVMGIILEPGQIPTAVGAVVNNVETVKHIAEAIEDRKPYIDKDLTVSGRVQQKETIFFDVPIGTSVKTLIEKVGGYVEPHGEIVIGGSMTGQSGDEDTPITKTSGGILVAMPFPQENRKIGLLICECGGSEERMTEIATNMGAEVVAAERCKRMVKVNGRYRCSLPGICPGQAQTVLSLKQQGAEVVMTGSCTD